MEQLLKQKQKEFVHQISTLNALSPLKVMERGYSITYDENDQIVKSVKDIAVGSSITVSFVDGTITGKVTARKEGNKYE